MMLRLMPPLRRYVYMMACLLIDYRCCRQLPYVTKSAMPSFCHDSFICRRRHCRYVQLMLFFSRAMPLRRVVVKEDTYMMPIFHAAMII